MQEHNQNHQTTAVPSGAAASPVGAGPHSATPPHGEALVTDWQEQFDYLRGLVHIVREEKLSELSVESAGVRLTVRSSGAVRTVDLAGNLSSPVLTAPDMAASASRTPSADANLVNIVTPMVGVFYRSLSPSDPPCVEVGDRVEGGQTVGLVEAMKVFNEIVSETDGVVVEIPGENGALVETGTTLVVIRKQ